MTDRHSGYLVTLSDDIREDDAQHIINALRMVKGVLSVEPIIHDHALMLAQQREAGKYEELLWRLYQHVRDNGPDSVLPEKS